MILTMPSLHKVHRCHYESHEDQKLVETWYHFVGPCTSHITSLLLWHVQLNFTNKHKCLPSDALHESVRFYCVLPRNPSFQYTPVRRDTISLNDALYLQQLLSSFYAHRKHKWNSSEFKCNFPLFVSLITKNTLPNAFWKRSNDPPSTTTHKFASLCIISTNGLSVA